MEKKAYLEKVEKASDVNSLSRWLLRICLNIFRHLKSTTPIVFLAVSSIVTFLTIPINLRAVAPIMMSIVSVLVLLKKSNFLLVKPSTQIFNSLIVVGVISVCLLNVFVVPNVGYDSPLGRLDRSFFLQLIWVATLFLLLTDSLREVGDKKNLLGYLFLVSVGLLTIGILVNKKIIFRLADPVSNGHTHAWDIWLNYPVSKHWFLIFMTEKEWLARHAYHGYSIFDNIFNYSFIKAGSAIFGLETYKIFRIFPIFYAAMLTLLYSWIVTYIWKPWYCQKIIGWIFLAISIAVLCSLPVQWLSTAPTQPPYTMAFWTVFLGSLLFSRKTYSPKIIWTVCVLIGLQQSFMACIAGIALFVAGLALQKTRITVASLTLAVSGVTSYLIQQSTIKHLLKGASYGSTLSRRSGLDGSKASSFANSFLASIAPSSRAFIHNMSLYWVIVIFTILSILISLTKKDLEKKRAGVFFFFAVYAFTVSLIPQAVAYHPNSYHMLFAFPGILSIPFVLSDHNFKNSRLTGLLPYLIFILIACFHHNLVTLARMAH